MLSSMGDANARLAGLFFSAVWGGGVVAVDGWTQTAHANFCFGWSVFGDRV